MTKKLFLYAHALALVLSTAPVLQAQVPPIMSYQGRIAVGATNFDGTGLFKFALVDTSGGTTYWSNDGTSTAGSEPATAVSLTVSKGLYNVLLGDSSLANMTAVPVGVFNNADVRLRVWFDDGSNGSQLLAPDQRIAAVGYAMIAGSVPDGAITSAKMANGAIGSTQLASGLSLNGTLTGNASTATSATTATTAGSFTGVLAGDVTGTQGATVVSLVGTSTAANIRTAELAANAATNANTVSTLVKRDASGSFSAGTITINSVLGLPPTDSATVGVINQNGYRLIHTFGPNNFFAGPAAGNFTMTGDENTIVGDDAFQSNTNGQKNVGVGRAALKLSATGDSNTAVGSFALTASTGASQNTAIGAHALDSTNGSNNTAVGYNVLQANTTGTSNTAVGWNALSNSSGGTSQNTAVGTSALNNSTGSNNTAMGYQALQANTTGTNNVAIGWQALDNNTGSSNIALGKSAGSNLTTGSNNIDIGNGGVAAESNTIRIGTTGTQTRAFVAGIRGVTTGVNDAVPLVIDSNGQLGTVSSSRRYKEDITDMGDVSTRLESLRPVTFRYQKPFSDGGKPVQFGLIAEEVAEIFPELVVYNADGLPETVKYQDLVPLLLNEVQKLKAEKQDLGARLEKIEAAIKEISK